MNAAIDFAVPALIVSGAALVALALAREAPPRLGFGIAMLGLAAWVLPWPVLDLSAVFGRGGSGTDWLAAGSAPLAALKTDVRAVLDAASFALGAAADDGAGLASWWLALTLPGLAWFALECASHRRRCRAWRRASRDGGHLRRLLPLELAARVPEIRLVPGSAVAATTGVVKPVVWLGDRIGNEQALRTALVHECCHVHAHDQFWLALIVLIRRVHWWNPVVAALAQRAGLLLEAACDRHCARLLGRRRYRRTLAELMLRAHERREAPLAATLSVGTNVRRLEQLGRRVRMDWRAYAAVALCATAGAAAADTEALRDPRLGLWLEVTRSSPSSPILRRFEDLGDGVTRVHSFIGPDGKSSTWSDMRCDGRRYRQKDENGVTLALESSCRVRDRSTVEFAFYHLDGSGKVDRGIEWVSSDGGTYSVNFETTDADGDVLQTVQRQFRRLE